MLKKVSERDLKQWHIMLQPEMEALSEGFHMIGGIDEAGRGPLAGPVVAAVCILDLDKPVYGLNDSKKLTPASRDRLYKEITEHALAWQVGIVSNEVIDQINILQATILAMHQAVGNLQATPDLLLVDAVQLKQMPCFCRPLIKGDTRSVSIAAASILAKVTRDRIMNEFDCQYPQYGLAKHKGYGTQEHYEALLRYGPTPIHRKTFLKNLDEKRTLFQDVP